MVFDRIFVASRHASPVREPVAETSSGERGPGIASVNHHITPAFGNLWFDVVAVAILFAAYTATLYVANHLHIGLAVLGGLANTIPVVLFGCGARWLIVRHLIGRSRLRQVVGHLCFGIVFSLLALWLLIILLGMMSDLSTVHFTVVPFTTRGNAWQLLENVTTYAAIAMLSYMQVWQRAVSTVSERAPQVAEKPQRPSDVSRHFIRRGEDILPVDLDRIVCVTGADDYAEVSTLDQTYLVKVTLTEFIRVLEPAKFLRIHRSSIVNLERINRAESAGGGRMLVHMTNGRTIKTSRAGSHLLRTRII